MKKHDDKKERVMILAEKIKLLFGFCADLIPDKDLIYEADGALQGKESRALAMAPILGAFGVDYEEVEFEARFKKERASALYHLIESG